MIGMNSGKMRWTGLIVGFNKFMAGPEDNPI
jgi:hypothetical protein